MRRKNFQILGTREEFEDFFPRTGTQTSHSRVWIFTAMWASVTSANLAHARESEIGKCHELVRRLMRVPRQLQQSSVFPLGDSLPSLIC